MMYRPELRRDRETQKSLPPCRSMRVSSWGRFPTEECDVYRPERVSELVDLVARAPQSTLLARGLGRSYGDAALNAGAALLWMSRIDRMIDFDADAGVLHCEAAVTFADILEVFLPRGFFLPVTPGTKFITVGGAIAADVHGKDHHRSGSMAEAVSGFTLLTARGERLDCSRDANAEIFWATLGGMGLTGVILDARIRLKRVETAYMDVETEKLADLDALLERLSDSDAGFDYSVAWIDCLSGGRSLGRSVLTRANHARPDQLEPARLDRPFEQPSRWAPSVPFVLPSGCLNRLAMRGFNECVYRLNSTRRTIVDCQRYFYPLDVLRDWNRIYGPRGMLQYQLVLPHESARNGLVEILEELKALRLSSFLCVLKTFGAASEGLLSFPRPGVTLSLDIPNAHDDVRSHVASLDAVVLRHGGRIYLAKDAVSSPEAMREMYPALGRFQQVKSRVDPEFRFSSSQSRRLGIIA